MTPSPEHFHWQQPAATVDVAALEKVLESLFGKTGPLTRASMLNLIAVCTCGADISGVMETATRIVAHHPSRVLLLDLCGRVPADGHSESAAQAAGGTAAGISAMLAATCFRSTPGGEQICCEVITLRSGEGEEQALASAVLALLVPDLPEILWWSGEADLRSPVFGTLKSSLDGMVLDLRRLRRWQEDLQLLSRIVHNGTVPWVGDLCWYRMQPWRELIAQAFDPPGPRRLLSRIREVRIGYRAGGPDEPPPSCLSDSLLLSAWFGDALGWMIEERLHPETPTSHRFSFRSSETPVPVVLQGESGGPWPSSLPPGALLHITLQIEKEEAIVTYRIGRDPEEPHIASSFSEEGILLPVQSLPVGEESTSGLLCRALDQIGRRDLYGRAILMASRIVG